MLKCGAMLNILIIEDDGETAAYTAKGLREDGHRVEIAADGPEGSIRRAAAVSKFWWWTGCCRSWTA